MQFNMRPGMMGGPPGMGDGQPDRETMVAALMKRRGPLQGLGAPQMQGGMRGGAGMPMPAIGGALPAIAPPQGMPSPAPGGMGGQMMAAQSPQGPPSYGGQFGIPPNVGNMMQQLVTNGQPQAQPGLPRSPEELQALLNMIQQRSGGGMPVG